MLCTTVQSGALSKQQHRQTQQYSSSHAIKTETKSEKKKQTICLLAGPHLTPQLTQCTSTASKKRKNFDFCCGIAIGVACHPVRWLFICCRCCSFLICQILMSSCECLCVSLVLSFIRSFARSRPLVCSFVYSFS